jgi:threonine synthase
MADQGKTTSFVTGLVCKECGTRFPSELRSSCDECWGPVEVEYDYEALTRVVTRERVESGPRSLWRYRDLLPISGEPATGLRSGFTPLIRAERLGRYLGVRELYVKDDSVNYPTFSYKDRVVSVAITKAVELGFDTVGCASTGNLAHSVAAHAAVAGLRAFVMVPHDLEEGKIVGSQVFGPRLVRILGNYDDVNRLCAQIADRYGWALVNVNLRPFYTEGAKTHGFEIAEQLGWRLPRHTVVPVAGGTILPKVWKAYRELVRLGLVADEPASLHGAQAAGCSPVVRALETGAQEITPQKPKTIARSIAIGSPADGPYALRAIRDSGGHGAAPEDGEILDAVQLLARTEGIFTEPAGGCTLAAAIRLLESGRIPKDEPICVCITGNGLKTVEVLQGRLPESPPIEATLEAFSEAVGAEAAAPLAAGARA